MTAILMPAGRLRYHATIDGVYGPAVGYKLWTYAAGTTTPKATYADADAQTQLDNPIILDANGECAPFGTGSYKLKLTDPDGATVSGWPVDDVLLTTDVIAAEWCGTAGGTGDAITLSPGASAAAYQSGQRFQFVCSAANTTAVTVSVSGLAAKALTWNGNTALAANDLVLGRIYTIQYDGTRFQLSGAPTASAAADDSGRLVTTEYLKDAPAGGQMAASDTTPGFIEVATAAENVTGTSTTQAVVPARQKYNPLHPKKVVRFAGRGTDGSCTISLNLGGTARVERKGAGYYRVLWSTIGTTDDMASNDYAVFAEPQEGSAPTSVGAFNAAIGSTIANIAIISPVAQDTTGVVFKCEGSSGGGARDPDYITVTVHGTLA